MHLISFYNVRDDIVNTLANPKRDMADGK